MVDRFRNKNFLLLNNETMYYTISLKLKLTYYPVPKNGNTSIRNLLYQIERGMPFQQPYELALLMGPAPEFIPVYIPGFDRVAVVRDPVQRFISAYRNRVLHYHEISRERMRRRGGAEALPERPTITQFIKNLEEYRKIWPIAQHTHPQTYFLGKDPGFFQRIFRLEKMHELEAYFSERLGRPVSLPRLRTEGPPAEQISLSASDVDDLKKFYEEDYRFLEAVQTVHHLRSSVQ